MTSASHANDPPDHRQSRHSGLPVTTIVFLGLYALICVGAAYAGYRMFHGSNPPEGVTPEQAKRFGRLLMMSATMLLIVPVAFWVHGDLKLGQP